MTKSPLVSVIVTTRNNQATLKNCLKSITAQSYKPVELIVVDNKSTDDTVAIAKRFTKRVYAKGPERSAQRNYAVTKAKGDYVLIIDSDMELPFEVVEECVAAMSSHTQAAIIPELSFGEGFWAQCKALERSFYVGVDRIEAVRFFNKSVFTKAGGYDEQIAGGEDWDLSKRVRALTDVSHTNTVIRHNEGHPTLKSIVTKRRYYAKGFHQYYKNQQLKPVGSSSAKQVLMYYGLYLRKPSKLFRNPVVGLGMLFMKTLEFGALAKGRSRT